MAKSQEEAGAEKLLSPLRPAVTAPLLTGRSGSDPAPSARASPSILRQGAGGGGRGVSFPGSAGQCAIHGGCSPRPRGRQLPAHGLRAGRARLQRHLVRPCRPRSGPATGHPRLGRPDRHARGEGGVHVGLVGQDAPRGLRPAPLPRRLRAPQLAADGRRADCRLVPRMLAGAGHRSRPPRGAQSRLAGGPHQPDRGGVGVPRHRPRAHGRGRRSGGRVLRPARRTDPAQRQPPDVRQRGCLPRKPLDG